METIREKVKGKDLPKKWRKMTKADPEETLVVTIEANSNEALSMLELPADKNNILPILSNRERSDLLDQMPFSSEDEDSSKWITDIKASRVDSENIPFLND